MIALTASGGALAALMLQALPAPAAPPARAEHAPAVAAEAAERAPHRRVRRSGLEDRVALLTKALELDAAQRDALRRVLTEHRARVQRIWSDASLPSAERIGLTRASSREAAERIRALLTPEQRKKYEPALQQGQAGAITNAHVEEWMERARR